VVAGVGLESAERRGAVVRKVRRRVGRGVVRVERMMWRRRSDMMGGRVCIRLGGALELYSE